MHLKVLRNPYILVLATIATAAAVITMYNRTLEPDQSKVNRAFFKILIIGGAVGLVFAYLASRPEPVMREPFFDMDAARPFQYAQPQQPMF